MFRRFYASIEDPTATPEYPQFVDGLRQLTILEAEIASAATAAHGWTCRGNEGHALGVKTPNIAIVGGGIVGLATAYRLLERYPGARVTVLEKEDAVGFVTKRVTTAACCTPGFTTSPGR